MIARIELYGSPADPCRKCAKIETADGRRIKNPFPGCNADGTDCSRCKGTGAVPGKGLRWPSRNLLHERCEPCKGTGRIPLTKALKLLYDEPPICSRCGGDGYQTPITVNKGPGQRHEASYVMDDAEAERDGVISRVLVHMEDHFPAQHLAVRMYLGSIGAHWGTRPEFRRIFALWPLTEAGAKLVKFSRVRDKSDHWANVDDHHVLAQEFKEQASSPQPERGALIGQATNAAVVLWDSTRLAMWRSDTLTGGRLGAYALRNIQRLKSAKPRK
jgi:hypothetical protein